MKLLAVVLIVGIAFSEARPSQSDLQELREELLNILERKENDESKPACLNTDPNNLDMNNKDPPDALEVNECAEKSLDKNCVDIDVEICEEECLLGYETNEDGCIISCRCKAEGLFDGDIMMTEEDVNKYNNKAADKAASKFLRRWNNIPQSDGTYAVPYVLDPSITKNPRAAAAISAAMSAYSEQTCMRFVPRKNERDYLYFYQGPGCWSYIGRRFGRQKISIGRGCEWKGIAMHEMMHAMGFFHEQSRPDRDNHVKILFENVRQGREGNFKKQPSRSIDSMGSPYDFGSVMHYGGYSFTKNRKPTIVNRKTGEPVKSQRIGFSVEDAKQLNMMYKCNERTKLREGFMEF